MGDLLDFGLGGLKSFAERVSDERRERLENAQHVLSFGMGYLDRALGGIFKNDLVLLGAKTGIGKTALATSIAMANVQAGKRVHYFALEAEDKEIERRIKYRLLTAMAWESLFAVDRERLSYLDWYGGKLEDLLERFDASAEKALAEKFRTLTTYYKHGDFNADDMVRLFLAVQDETDLIVLDHLHYVDTDDANENRGYKTIVKKLRDVALRMGKPVVCVAHVRKGDRRSKQLIPGIEDFHGTSDVPKISTKAVMIAPAYDMPSTSSFLWNTYVHVGKCRLDGSRTRYAAVVPYNSRREGYSDEFILGRLKDCGEEFESLKDRADWPRWAR